MQLLCCILHADVFKAFYKNIMIDGSYYQTAHGTATIIQITSIVVRYSTPPNTKVNRWGELCILYDTKIEHTIYCNRMPTNNLPTYFYCNVVANHCRPQEINHMASLPAPYAVPVNRHRQLSPNIIGSSPQ